MKKSNKKEITKLKENIEKLEKIRKYLLNSQKRTELILTEMKNKLKKIKLLL